MKVYQVVIRREAELDLRFAYEWYEEQIKGLGSEFLRSVEASIFSIQRSPELCSKIHKNIRRHLVRKFPYGVFYLIDEEKVVVLGVFHVRRDPEQWKGR